MTDQPTADGTRRIALGREDRAILALECATIAGHTCKVMRLGSGAPSVTAVRDRIAERLHLTPALTWRLDDGAGNPSWEPDPNFDLQQHVVEHRHQASARIRISSPALRRWPTGWRPRPWRCWARSGSAELSRDPRKPAVRPILSAAQPWWCSTTSMLLPSGSSTKAA